MTQHARGWNNGEAVDHDRCRWPMARMTTTTTTMVMVMVMAMVMAMMMVMAMAMMTAMTI